MIGLFLGLLLLAVDFYMLNVSFFEVNNVSFLLESEEVNALYCLHLQHVLLRGIFVVCVSGIGYAAAISYRLFLRSQRAALLDEPLDILGGKY